MLAIRLILEDEEYTLREKEKFISKEDFEKLEEIGVDDIEIEDIDNVMQLSYKNIFIGEVKEKDFVDYFKEWYSEENARMIYGVILGNQYTWQLEIDVYYNYIDVYILDDYVYEDFEEIDLETFNFKYDADIKTYEELDEKAIDIETEKQQYGDFTILNVDKENNAILMQKY